MQYYHYYYYHYHRHDACFCTNPKTGSKRDAEMKNSIGIDTDPIYRATGAKSVDRIVAANRLAALGFFGIILPRYVRTCVSIYIHIICTVHGVYINIFYIIYIYIYT